MGKDERYDVVVVGGGPNGMTTAAYLSKCGLSACALVESFLRNPQYGKEDVPK